MSRLSIAGQTLFGAVALTIALSLAGCGQATSEPASTEEAAAESSAESSGETADNADDQQAGSFEDIELVDGLESVEETVKTIALNEEMDENADLSEYPERTDGAIAIDVEDTIGDAIEDQSKAPAGQTLLVNGGMEILIPNSWYFRSVSTGFEFRSGDGSIVGCMDAARKQSGYTYDVVAAAASAPRGLAEQGFTDIEIVNSGVGSSSRGTVCGAFVLLTCRKGGIDYAFYTEFLESKNYINALVISGSLADFNNHISEISSVANSVNLAQSEIV